MKFGGLVFGMLLYFAKAVPMDPDAATMMMAQVGGAVMGIAQDVNPQMDMNKKIAAGPFEAESGASFKAKDTIERRKRSMHDDDEVLPQPKEHRHKRSPCNQRNRRQRTTDAPPTNGQNGNSGNNDAGNGNGSGDELPRRRKRSPQNNDIDEDIEMKHSFGEGLQDITRELKQFFKNFADTMAGLVENIKQRA